MEPLLGDWASLLPDTVQETAQRLFLNAAAERAAGKTVYPAQEQIFRALRLTPPASVRAVIVGQDPYHEAGQACGLAFSVEEGTKIPPSLRNIFKELAADTGCAVPASGDLTPWAARGVLLLNTVLTVEDGRANSHADWGWQIVTSAVVRACSELSQPLVFLLFGAQARNFCAKQIVDTPAHLSLCTSHPSPLSAYRGDAAAPAFLGSRPFSRADAFLAAHGVPSVFGSAER